MRMDLRLIPFKHNAWATRAQLDLCRPLSDEQFHRRFEIGCGNLHDTFVHIIGAMDRWADRIAGVPLPPREEDPTQRTVDELSAMLDRAATKLEAVARRIIHDNRVDEMMEFPGPEGQPPYRFHRGTAMVHVTTHGMHHRAQIFNMLRHLGVKQTLDGDAVEWELFTGEYQERA
jgi:uncharacterized damage-inducible protein DinB